MAPSDANGNFSLVPSYLVQNGDTVLPVQHNPPLEDIANGLTNRIMRDGRTVMTGNLQMGGNKVTNVAPGTNNGDALNVLQLRDRINAVADFATVADMLADNGQRIGYADSGARVIVTPGQIITAQGFRYEVAASDAVDWHVETAGGVNLYVVSNGGEYHTAAFGALSGEIDDVVAVRKAFEVANSKATFGLASHIRYPGATVVMSAGEYDFTTIASRIDILCNMRDAGAKIVVGAAYAGTVWWIGESVGPNNMTDARIEVPETYKPTSSPLVVGSTGVRLANINASIIRMGALRYFDILAAMGGIGEGTVYNQIFFSQMVYGNRLIRIAPGPGGWFNSNQLFGGNLRLGGDRVAGQYHVDINGEAPSTAVVGNTFIGQSYEGPGAQWVIHARNAYGNTWIGTYNETQGPERVVSSVAGSDITSTAHGLSVGDMVMFYGTAAPTGMQQGQAYYVASVADADTFTVAISKIGTSIVFSGSAAALKFRRQSRCVFDGSGGNLTFNNRLINTFAPPSVALDIVNTGSQAYNNSQEDTTKSARAVFDPVGLPVWRGQNRTFATTQRPIYAAYAPDVDTESNPSRWTTALSDRGVLFKTAGGDVAGRLTSGGALLQWESNTDGVVASVPNGFRSPTYVALTDNVPANGRVLVSLPVTGAAMGDYIALAWASALPVGILVAWSRVSAPDTVQVCLQNITGTNVVLPSSQVRAMTFRQNG